MILRSRPVFVDQNWTCDNFLEEMFQNGRDLIKTVEVVGGMLWRLAKRRPGQGNTTEIPRQGVFRRKFTLLVGGAFQMSRFPNALFKNLEKPWFQFPQPTLSLEKLF